MGTEKYPDENHFEEFIGRFGGYSNASTHESFTRYHVSHKLLVALVSTILVWNDGKESIQTSFGCLGTIFHISIDERKYRGTGN